MSGSRCQRLTPAGTILCGRGSVSQLSSEILLSGVRFPEVVMEKEYRGKVLRIIRKMEFPDHRMLPISIQLPTEAADMLILVGRAQFLERFRDDTRIKAYIVPDTAALAELERLSAVADGRDNGIGKDLVNFLVIDNALVRKKQVIESFFKSWGGNLIGKLGKNRPDKLDIHRASSLSGASTHSGTFVYSGAFTYCCNTEVFSGDDALSELPALMEKMNGKKPLILTDKGIMSTELPDLLMQNLGSAASEAVIFDDIPQDSSLETVNEISRIFRDKQRDILIALGGGSVLDTGKGVYLNVSLGSSDLNKWVGSNRIPSLKTPFIAIPTTSGTGSEVTKAAVIHDLNSKRKLPFISSNLQPDAAILDSRMTVTLPPFLTAITAMDAFSHAVEAYTCLGKNPISDQMAWKAIELIMDNLSPVLTDTGNLELRRNLALASCLAGQAFSNSMVGMVHTIGHTIGSVCRAPHGSCMAVLLPAVLEYNYGKIKHELSELLEVIGGSSLNQTTPAAHKARKLIEVIRKFNADLKKATNNRHPVRLRDITDREGNQLVRREDFELIAEQSMGDPSIVYNPRELGVQDVMDVLESVY